jgi:hypothetical protein
MDRWVYRNTQLIAMRSRTEVVDCPERAPLCGLEDAMYPDLCDLARNI